MWLTLAVVRNGGDRIVGGGVARRAEQEAEDPTVALLQRPDERAREVGRVAGRILLHHRRVASEADQATDGRAGQVAREEYLELVVGRILHADEARTVGGAVCPDFAIGVDRSAIECPAGGREPTCDERRRAEARDRLGHRPGQEGMEGVEIPECLVRVGRTRRVGKRRAVGVATGDEDRAGVEPADPGEPCAEGRHLGGGERHQVEADDRTGGPRSSPRAGTARCRPTAGPARA